MSKTPIAFLFASDESKPPWSFIPPTRRFSPFLKRHLSWSETDALFGSFLNFLDNHGVESTLSHEVWQELFLKHIDYRPNCHFLFFLWLPCCDHDTSPPPSFWLPEKTARFFSIWAKRFKQDLRFTEDLQQSATSSPIATALTFRGINLAQALVYPAMTVLVSNTLAESSDVL